MSDSKTDFSDAKIKLASADELLSDLDPEQRKVALNLFGPMRVIAGAGAGKTRAITYRIAYGIKTGAYNPKKILALTFTNKAANEMRERIEKLCDDDVNVSTFHSEALKQFYFFWHRINDAESLNDISADEDWSNVSEKDARSLATIPAKSEFRKSRDASGMYASPVTANAKRSGENVRDAGEYARGIGGSAKRSGENTRSAYGDINGDIRSAEPPELKASRIDILEGAIKDYLKDRRARGKKYASLTVDCLANAKRISKSDTAFVAAEIGWAKISLIAPEDYEEYATLAKRPEWRFGYLDTAKLYYIYELYKKSNNYIDFEDPMLVMTHLIRTNACVANYIHNKYKYFTVDEYQDISPIQQMILEEWSGDCTNICVVGDPNQTIYSFAGATDYYLKNFAEIFEKNKGVGGASGASNAGEAKSGAATPGDASERDFISTVKVDLFRDYRSTPEIVGVANKIFGSNEGLELYSPRESGESVVFEKYPTEEDEIENVCRNISNLIEGGVDPQDIAILFRINAQGLGYAAKLREYEIPYLIKRDDDESFYDRKTVKNCINCIKEVKGRIKRVLTDEEKEKNFDSYINDAFENVQKKNLSLRSRKGFVDENILAGDIFAFKNFVVEPYKSTENYKNRVDDPADALAYLIKYFEYLKGNEQGINAYELAECVTLSTVHAAKGLEWKHVFVVGLSEGMFPYEKAIRSDNVYEERRLFYVAVTRAKDRLYLSYSQSERSKKTLRSRFLDGIWKNLK